MSSERQPCTICGGHLYKNGTVQVVDGRRRQFYRCEDCRQGGWTIPRDERDEFQKGYGPVFEGLSGKIADQIARNHAAEVRV